jgi:hypothetical protein
MKMLLVNVHLVTSLVHLVLTSIPVLVVLKTETWVITQPHLVHVQLVIILIVLMLSVHNVLKNVQLVLDVMVLVTLVLNIDLVPQLVTVLMDIMVTIMNVMNVHTNVLPVLITQYVKLVLVTELVLQIVIVNLVNGKKMNQNKTHNVIHVTHNV